MNNKKKILASPWFTTCSFLLAAALLLFAGIGGARAALNIKSRDYRVQGELYDIGVTLNESVQKEGKEPQKVAWRDYNGKGVPDADTADGTWDEVKGSLVAADTEVMKADKKPVRLGQEYPEFLSVTNTGNVNEYVRATIYTYWEKNGKKDTSLDPTKIHVHLSSENVGSGKAWIEDTRKDAKTDERTVVYYSKLLKIGDTTPAFTDTFSVDPAVALQVTKHEERKEQKTDPRDGKKYTYTTFKTTYDYHGARFVVKVVVDAVQEHNAQKAAISAWGPDISISGGKLSLK